ncbi:MAG TPA: hypothetical protein VLB83_05515 [Candidatus Paceibacterota bacterium]|nr:hypothetical protein [Candidatus Paceibacterota bacterium]
MNQLALRLSFGPALLQVFLKQEEVCERVRGRYPKASYTDEEIIGVLYAMETHGRVERKNEYLNISSHIGTMVRDLREEIAGDTQNSEPDEVMKNVINALEGLSDEVKDFDPLPCPLWRKRPRGKKRRPPTNTAEAGARTQHLHA